MVYMPLELPWVYHYYTCSSGRGVPCSPERQQNRAGVKAKGWKYQKSSKQTIIGDGHCPSKAPFCRGGFCSNPCKLIVLFGEPSPQGFVFQVTWEVRIFTLWAWHLSLTSARNAPHSWFISPWSYHECTTTTHACKGWNKILPYNNNNKFCPVFVYKKKKNI